jgi:hypothetical protein
MRLSCETRRCAGVACSLPDIIHAKHAHISHIYYISHFDFAHQRWSQNYLDCRALDSWLGISGGSGFWQ